MSGLFDGTPLEQPVTCERCHQSMAECRCPRDGSGKILLPKDQQVRVQRERRGGGKMVTVVTGLDPKASDLPALLKRLKAACAAGGTVAEGSMEIQGDHRDKLVTMLKELGYPAKASGG